MNSKNYKHDQDRSMTTQEYYVSQMQITK